GLTGRDHRGQSFHFIKCLCGFTGPLLGKKFCGLFIYPGQSVRQVVAVSAPGDRDSYGCVALGRQ
ncbi:hypothetical protein EXX00_24990, partial [Escherichia coli]